MVFAMGNSRIPFVAYQPSSFNPSKLRNLLKKTKEEHNTGDFSSFTDTVDNPIPDINTDEDERIRHWLEQINRNIHSCILNLNYFNRVFCQPTAK